MSTTPPNPAKQRQLAALEPGKFKKGKSGNPNGRPNAGATIKEWFNQLSRQKPADIRKIAKSRNEIAAKKAAAMEWVVIFDKRAEDSANKSLDRIMEHTDGRPSQKIDLAAEIELSTPRQALQGIQRLLGMDRATNKP